MSVSRVTCNTLKRYKSQATKMRYHVNNNMMKLCKNGDVTNALQIYDNEMSQKHIMPNTYTLFALLIGCRESQNVTIAHKIWSKLVIDEKIHADVNCYEIIMNLLSKGNHKNIENSDLMMQIINDIKYKSENELSEKEWFIIINSLSVIGNITLMMNEYNNMIVNSGYNTLNAYILRCLFEGIINFGQPHFLELIWNDITTNNSIQRLSEIIDCKVVQSLIVGICRSQRYYQFKHNFLCNVWHLIISKLHINISADCYCIAILTFSKYGKDGKEFEIFNQLISNENIMDEIQINCVGFRQILTAFGNVGMLDECWNIYHEKVKNNDNFHDMDALNTLLQIEYRTPKLMDIIDVIKNVFDYKALDLYSLMALYRAVNKCNNEINIQFKNELETVLNVNTNNANNNIIACFELNGKQWIIKNGIDYNCQFNSVYKVDKLIKDSKYIFDQSVCSQIPNEIARGIHLQYHAEKKALSILLFETFKTDKHHKICNISVSIPMCNDCHKFFAQMSKHCDCEIHCIDPNGLHVFQDGYCSLCR